MKGRSHIAARKAQHGFSLIELMFALLVGTILTAMAIPVWGSAQAYMRLNSAVSTMSAALTQARFQAIMTSQPYSVTINAPADTYVVTNLKTGVASNAIPITPHGVAINGGAAAAYTFVFCPNGTVWAAGAACPGAGVPPVLTAAYQGRLINLNISSVGNVTTK
jgi:prepilin-type N-terminal cleavage/methylation domain-containing protein